MPLANALYKSQEQNEQDLTQGPGWTIDEQKPTVFSNFAGAIPRGIGQGGADALAALAHGSAMVGDAARESALAEAGLPDEEATPWKQAAPAAETEAAAREFSKSLTPDPRITGTGANIVQGFSKAVTEFGVGAAAGGPLGGASLLGASDGYAHYQDLRDQGVDEETAKRSGLLEAVTSGGSALLPMGMPARWLKGLSTAGTIAAQAGAGAVINTSFGAASRYASAKILDDAGYHEMAEQMKPWDETNVITDALAGVFFGAHAGIHGLNELKAADVDPSIRDAAKVVQDRQEVNDRAPGVPVDMKSAAVHRASLETALGDLMNDKPVDLSQVDTEGATFARPEIDETPTAAIIREEFKKSGVLDFADDFDRWLAGEKPREPKEVSIEPPEATPEPVEARATEPGSMTDQDSNVTQLHLPVTEPAADIGSFPIDAANAPSARKPWTQRLKPIDMGGASSEELLGKYRQLPPAVLADRPDLQIVNEHGEALHAGDEQAKAVEAEAQANKEADPMHQAAVDCEARHQ